MAYFVYFGRTPSQGGMGYSIAHSPITSRRSNLETVVFAAFVKNSNEKIELPAEFNGVKTEQRRIGNLECSIVRSEFSHYKTLMKSRSPESKALYAGHILPEKQPQVVMGSLRQLAQVPQHLALASAERAEFLQEGEEFGMLLQYLPAGATTTAHLHTHKEGYFIIYGRAFAYPLNGNAQDGEAVPEFPLGWGKGGRERNLSNTLIVPGNTWHPLKGLEDSLIIIVAHRSIVEDQVSGTRNNHHHSMSFENFSKQFTVSGTQRSSGLSAAAREAGSR